MAEFTRRVFLRTGVLSAAGLALGNKLDQLLYALDKEGDLHSFQKAIQPFTTFPTICIQCQARCGIIGLVVDHELIGVLGNPRSPNNKGGICARALAGINLLYDPERILYPLKRKAERGSNQWERISWKVAIDEISMRLNQLRLKGNIEQFLVQLGVDEGVTPAQSLLKGIGPPTLIDDVFSYSLNKRKAHEWVWGEEDGLADVAKSRYILNFGSNPYEGGENYIPFVQRLISARVDHHAKLITFDVRLSNTAGRSDEWYPLRPGTDRILILSLCKIILDLGLADIDFLSKWTNLPYEQIRSFLSPYSPERTEKVSGVDAKEIKRIAIEFATLKPSVAFCGNGLIRHPLGIYNQIAILLLNALVGNIDQKGGYGLPKRYLFPQPLLRYPVSGLDDLLDRENRPIDIYLTYLSNPVYRNPSGNRIAEILKDKKKVPFYVAVDTHITETSLFADLILPVATPFESWGLESRPAMERVPIVGLRQPIIQPRGETLSFSNILNLISEKINKGIRISEIEYLQKQLEKIEGLRRNGVINYLRREGFWLDPNLSPSYLSYKQGGFKTPSGKMELYPSKLKKEGIPLFPVPSEDAQKLRLNKGEFFLTTFRKNVTSDFNPNSKWLSEVFHENPLWMNPQTAERLGIRDGERVEIYSNGVRKIVLVRFTESVHPEVVAIARDLGHWAYGHVAMGRRFKSSDPDSSLIWWRSDKSFHINWLLREEKDRLSGGMGWESTVVTIKKIGRG